MTDKVKQHLNETERFEAISNLVTNHTLEARKIARSGLLDESGLVRHEAAFVLGSIGRDRDDLSALLSCLSDPSPFVRHEAALAVGQIGNPDCVETLRKGLSDAVPEVAASCAIAITKIESTAREHR
jgi:deoxyhypusine monooxygenase